MPARQVIHARAHGPGTPPPAGTAVPGPVLAFLRRAYPSWDYGDLSAHERLARGFPAAQVTDRVSREIREVCDVDRTFTIPIPPFLCYRIFFPAKRPPPAATHARPLQPTGGWLSKLGRKREGPAAEGGSVPVLGDVWICALGPFATFSQSRVASSPDFEHYAEGQRLRSVAVDVLGRNEVELLPWEVLDTIILDMKGTPFGKERSTPTVYDCLFERLV